MPDSQIIPTAAASALAEGDFESAFDLIQAELTLKPNYDLLLQYAFLLWGAFEYERAEECFRRLIDDPQAELQTLQRIAKAYFSCGRFVEAAAIMQTAVERQTAAGQAANAECLHQLASCLERSGRTAAAWDISEQALRFNPSDSRSVRLLAHLEKRGGDYEPAISRLEQHLRRHPGDWDWGLRYELAACLDRVGQYDAAWNHLLAAKTQLGPRAAPHLQASYRIRKRQGEVTKRITDTDLENWHRQSIDSHPQTARVAFLAGFPRSGTTLLEQILTANPECVGTDETGIMTEQFVASLVWNAADSFDAVLELRALESDQIIAGRQTFLRFTQAFIGEPIDGRLLIEKDPLMTSDLAVRLRLFPEAPLIMPLRDPRDVAVSYFFTMVPLNWNSSPAVDIAETARFYHDAMRHWLALRPRLLCPTIETRYENMVVDPHHEARRLSEFLGLSFDEAMLDVSRRSEEKAIRTPTYDDVTKPLYRRAIGRWENYREQLEPAMSILEPYAKEFGYA